MGDEAAEGGTVTGAPSGALENTLGAPSRNGAEIYLHRPEVAENDAKCIVRVVYRFIQVF